MSLGYHCSAKSRVGKRTTRGCATCDTPRTLVDAARMEHEPSAEARDPAKSARERVNLVINVARVSRASTFRACNC